MDEDVSSVLWGDRTLFFEVRQPTHTCPAEHPKQEQSNGSWCYPSLETNICFSMCDVTEVEILTLIQHLIFFFVLLSQ